MYEPQWIPVPLDHAALKELVVFGSGKDTDVIIACADGHRIIFGVGDVRVATEGRVLVESIPFDDVSRTLRFHGPGMRLVEGHVAWPGSEDDEDYSEEITTQLHELCDPSTSEEKKELGFVVDAQFTLRCPPGGRHR